jgi:Fe-S cluster assembly ATP-binding protein
MLEVKGLRAGIDGLEILKGLSLSIPAGEIHAIMGPNGSGKSTFANVIAGHPGYAVSDGAITFHENEILELAPEERAQQGIFLAFQYPQAIPGVSVAHFLRLSLNALKKARGEEPTGLAPFIRELRARMKTLGIPGTFAERSVNDGFSGGEKKRLEMLQMLILKPRLIILDEIDSGLDIDAIKVVAQAVHAAREERPETTVLAITHYQRLLDYVTPDHVHVMRDGQVIKSGGPELARELEKSGYADL